MTGLDQGAPPQRRMTARRAAEARPMTTRRAAEARPMEAPDRGMTGIPLLAARRVVRAALLPLETKRACGTRGASTRACLAI